jgi:hypothetical protein
VDDNILRLGLVSNRKKTCEKAVVFWKMKIAGFGLPGVKLLGQ